MAKQRRPSIAQLISYWPCIDKAVQTEILKLWQLNERRLAIAALREAIVVLVELDHHSITGFPTLHDSMSFLTMISKLALYQKDIDAMTDKEHSHYFKLLSSQGQITAMQFLQSCLKSNRSIYLATPDWLVLCKAFMVRRPIMLSEK